MNIETVALKLQEARKADLDIDLIERLSALLCEKMESLPANFNPQEVNRKCKEAGVEEDYWPFS